MANEHPDHPQFNSDDESAERGNASFAWEFGRNEQASEPASTAPHRPDGTRQAHERDMKIQADAHTDRKGAGRTPKGEAQWQNDASRASASVLNSAGRFGPARANYIRDQLDRGLEGWWATGELPPLLLLRDGLLMLEAGGSASESQRTLLLRAALAYGKGVQTALRHQVDAERVALVLAEALVEWTVPIAPENLVTLLAGDEKILTLLLGELERSRILLTGEPRRRAQAALDVLQRPLVKAAQYRVPPLRSTGGVVRRRGPLRQILLILLLIALVGFVLWQQRKAQPTDMIAMPAATYPFLGMDGTMASATLESFWIDRFEVTNREYRRCVEAGACVWPVNPSSATRADYFTNPAFDGNPVVNVTQLMAATYCAWRDRRLPSAAEWQVSAGVAPSNGQAFRYPWGETFDAQRANSAGTNFGDTVVVGSFRPAGDSPSGAADMAGNVAEWTTTLVGGEGPVRAIVKGGSYASEAQGIEVSAQEIVDVKHGRADIGFRCALSQ